MSCTMPRPSSRARRLLTACALTGAALAGSGALQPATADAYWTPLDSNQIAYGDCTLSVGMYRWAYGNYAIAYGQASCRSVKTRTSVRVTLKKNLGAETTANTTEFTNSYGMGSRWLWTDYLGGCATYQAVMNVTIVPYAPTFVTTGAPVGVCNRSAKVNTKRPQAMPERATTRAPA